MKRTDEEVKSYLIVTLAVIVILVLLTVVLVYYVIKVQSEIKLSSQHDTPATIEYCDRHNVCNTAEVEEFELVYNSRLMDVNHYVRFQHNGETIIWKTERARVILHE